MNGFFFKQTDWESWMEDMWVFLGQLWAKTIEETHPCTQVEVSVVD